MKTIKTMLKNSLELLDIECKINPFIKPQSLQRKLITSKNQIIFDVGAHHGKTYLEYRSLFPNATIHLVEPFAESVDIIKKCSSSDPQCHIHNVALSNECGERTLFINEASATNSLNSLSDSAAVRWASAALSPKSELVVEVKTLDSLASELGIDNIDVVKMDVQGAEMDVLKGSNQLLTNQSIGLFQFEFISVETYENQRPIYEYLQLMDYYGYSLVDFYEPIRRNGKMLQCDLMFANSVVARCWE